MSPPGFDEKSTNTSDASIQKDQGESVQRWQKRKQPEGLPLTKKSNEDLPDENVAREETDHST